MQLELSLVAAERDDLVTSLRRGDVGGGVDVADDDCGHYDICIWHSPSRLVYYLQAIY